MQNVNATGSPGAWQENTINTRRRLAAGLCVLSLVLLFGGFGGTVATADAETGDSVSDAGGSIGDAAGSISGTKGSVSGTEGFGGKGEQAGTAETEPPAGGTPEPGDNYEASGGLTGPMALGASTDDAAVIRRAAGECLRRVPLEKRLRLLGVRVTALTPRGAAGETPGPSQGELSLA